MIDIKLNNGTEDIKKYINEIISDIESFEKAINRIKIKRSIGKLRASYRFVNEIDLFRHLQDNPALIVILEGIAENIFQYFHKDDELILDVFRDPEEPEPEYIVVKIITLSSIEDPFERLEEFEHDWYFEHVDIIRTNLIFDFGYR